MTSSEDLELSCPFTGLRSFTEEESLYFKGRDLQVDQITALLEKNRFLMVTGASGEGKSSIIYAGLIPNARAGFFKARFTNWVVADFRPERSPVKNMARALADQFETSAATVETELRRGFSSLIDLYTSSPYYIDDQDSDWQQLPDSEKKEKGRKAANLIILVDQFEEFFTNPENFHSQAPSQDSQIVVNLILESARIALKRNLPVYIICTMRSDYIGQCPAFRGLAEYIGFSQFFVPRLKRKDLKQVIEEPTLLSGNSISKRLVERLVFDISEGVDQLPILQHALSQVWMAADKGREQMDLLHYAMVGGMSADELPDEDKEKFLQWFATLPPQESQHYSETGLHKIIEIHASALYENAATIFNAQHGEHPITQQQAKRIIAVTFSCLTKIDNSRAVRNRMSLADITGIINESGVTVETVGGVLDVFRKEGNSFIRPFHTDDPHTHHLSGETVLDITHESLIRNWKKLNQWAAKEFDFYSTYLDLRKQLDRWRESEKSDHFLLPIGPLTYFENWYSTCKPNVYWIRRYAGVSENNKESLASAQIILEDINAFLKRSASKVMVTRAFVKYGAGRLVIWAAVLVMVVMSGFYLYDASQKENSNVIAEVKQSAGVLLASESPDMIDKTLYMMNEERLSPGAIMKRINDQADAKGRISLSMDAYFSIVWIDKRWDHPVKQEIISTIESDLQKIVQSGNEAALLKERTRFILTLAYDNYYQSSDSLAFRLEQQSKQLYPLIMTFFQHPEWYKSSVSPKINQAIQLWLSFGKVKQQDLNAMIKLISPLEEGGGSLFSVYYPQGSFEPNGLRPLDFNGGYHMLASLYAAAGRPDEVIRCFDMLKTQPDYFTDRVFNNCTNVIGYFYQFEGRHRLAKIATWLKVNFGKTEESIWKELLIRSGYLSHMYRVNHDLNGFTEEGRFQLNLCLASREQFNAIASDYEKIVRGLPNADERNFLLATHFKREAIFDFKYTYDRNLSFSKEHSDDLLSQALQHFNLVSDAYRNEKISSSYSYMFGVRRREWTRKSMFLYPDYLDGWLIYNYHSDLFFNYLRDHDLLTKLYKSPEDLNLIHYWITNSFETRPFYLGQSIRNNFPMKDTTLISVLQFVSSHPDKAQFDPNLLLLVLSNRAFDKGDTLGGLKYFKQIRTASLPLSVRTYELYNGNFVLNQMMLLASHLTVIGKPTEFKQIMKAFDDESHKVYVYNHIAYRTYDLGQYQLSFAYADSAYSIWKKSGFRRPLGQDFRPDFIHLYTRIGGERLAANAEQILSELSEGEKFQGRISMVDGYAEADNYYKALKSIPDTFTEAQDLIGKDVILWHEVRNQPDSTGTWRTVHDFYSWNYVNFMGFGLD